MNQTLRKSGLYANSFCASCRAASGELILMIGGSPRSSCGRSIIEVSGPAIATRGAAELFLAASLASKFQNGPPTSATEVTPLASQTLKVAGSRALLRSTSLAYGTIVVASTASGRVKGSPDW